MSNVNHPSHYASSKIEVIVALEAWGLDKNFYRGNAVKYIARAGKKDPAKEVEDLEKAVWYLKREIEVLKAAKEKREPIAPNDMNPANPKTESFSSVTAALSSRPSEPLQDSAKGAIPDHDSDFKCSQEYCPKCNPRIPACGIRGCQRTACQLTHD